jgi:hypothetical protein
MKLSALHTEGMATELGHLGLDLVGLIPGAEAADFANMMWYLKEKRYVSAAFSLMSIIPGIGDTAGKGIKYLGKGRNSFAIFMMRYGDDIIKGWSKVKNLAHKSKKLQELIGDENLHAMDRAINKVISDGEQLQKTRQEDEKTRSQVLKQLETAF